MAENLVVNDVTYPEVEAVSMTNEAGEQVAFYPDAVRYNQQTLTDAQKAQARTNMGATSAEDVNQLSAEKVDKTSLTLGLHADGKYYIFVDGAPVGSGLELSGGDVFGYVDQNNNVVLNGNLPDGDYTIKYEMEDGSVIEIGDLVLDSNTYYSVTNNLTNCTNSNSDTQAIGGQSYSATISANDGYELSSVVVTMGGVDVSATAVSGGNISIAEVTGNIVVTAVAEEKKVAEPVTKNITLLESTSLKGTNFDEDRTGTAGYCATVPIDLTNIPKPCTIHLTGACWAYKDADDAGYIRSSVFDTSGNRLQVGYTHYSWMPAGITMVYNTDNRQDVTVTVTGNNIGKVRFAGATGNAGDNSGTGYFADAKATLTYTPN